MSLSLPDLTSPQSSIELKEYLGPQVEWEKTDLSVEDIIKNETLPVIATFEEDLGGEEETSRKLSPGLKVYSRQAVMLYMKTKKRQVKARTIHKDKGGRYMEVGQSLTIPEDYQGWFEVMPSDFTRSTCLLTIAEVAEALPKRFFTRSHIRALRVEGEGEDQKFMERKISPGSVIKTKGRFKAKLKTKAQTGLFKKKTTEWITEEVCYLKCLDTDEEEIMIPFTHKGKFNPIYEPGKISQNAVYSISDVMNDLTLPVRVRLLYGKAPVVPCIFTGMLVLRNLSTDETVIGSTVLSTRNVLFELPSNAAIKVNVTSNDETFSEMESYKDGQKLCEKYSKLFNNMIKLSPNLDTDQKVILHMPSDPKLMEQSDEAFRALDLVTDISLTNEPPRDHNFLNSSDSGSVNSEDQSALPKGCMLEGIEEFQSSGSQTHV